MINRLEFFMTFSCDWKNAVIVSNLRSTLMHLSQKKTFYSSIQSALQTREEHQLKTILKFPAIETKPSNSLLKLGFSQKRGKFVYMPTGNLQCN